MLKRSGRCVLAWLAVAGAPACGGDGIARDYGFEGDAEGWVHGVADWPADADEGMYEIEFAHRALPPEIEPPGTGLLSSGRNFSDDLFLFLKREITGLQPGALYRVHADLELASDAPSGCFGIGGAPGEDVHLKLGATTDEPTVREDDGGWLRMSVDKGNQAAEGDDAHNLGTVDNGLEECSDEVPFRRIERSGSSPPARANGSGSLWVFVGTDSGFEGVTTIYYDRIELAIVRP